MGMTLQDMLLTHPDLYKTCPMVAGRPTVLIYASCHGRTLVDYLIQRQDFMQQFNLARLETGPMTQFVQSGVDIFEVPEIKLAMQSAEVVLTNNMGARNLHHALDRIRHRFSPTAKIITFTAPNFSAFWPFAHGYTGIIGLLDMFDRGVSKDNGWQSIIHGDFDPLFNLRWRLEMGRLSDKDDYHDIGLADFVKHGHKKAKLFMSSSHPSYLPMAHVGSALCGMLGLPTNSLEEILAMDYKRGAIGGQGETDYEFKHFGFEYPIRHRNDAGGWAYYLQIYNHIYEHWLSGSSVLKPPAD